MSGEIEHSAWRRDPESSKKGLIFSLLVHGALGIAFVMSASGHYEAPPKTEEPSLIVFDVPGPRTPRPIEKVVAISEPKSAISKALPIPSDAPVAKMAVPEGGSGSEALIWTPPQPGYGYNAVASSGGSGAPTYVDVPIPLIIMPGEELKPIFVRFDGGLFVEASKEFAKLGPERRAVMIVELPVDIEGKTIGCSVIEGQVSVEIDTMACRLLMANTYRPAQDRAGKPVVGYANASLSWDGARFAVVEGKRELSLNEDGQVQLVDLDKVVDEGETAPAGIVDPSK